MAGNIIGREDLWDVEALTDPSVSFQKEGINPLVNLGHLFIISLQSREYTEQRLLIESLLVSLLSRAEGNFGLIFLFVYFCDKKLSLSFLVAISSKFSFLIILGTF